MTEPITGATAMALHDAATPGEWHEDLSAEAEIVTDSGRLHIGSFNNAADAILASRSKRFACAIAALEDEHDWLMRALLYATGQTVEHVQECMKIDRFKPPVNLKIGAMHKAKIQAEDERDALAEQVAIFAQASSTEHQPRVLVERIARGRLAAMLPHHLTNDEDKSAANAYRQLALAANEQGDG